MGKEREEEKEGVFDQKKKTLYTSMTFPNNKIKKTTTEVKKKNKNLKTWKKTLKTPENGKTSHVHRLHTYRKITHIVIATELLTRVPKSHIGEKRQSL